MAAKKPFVWALLLLMLLGIVGCGGGGGHGKPFGDEVARSGDSGDGEQSEAPDPDPSPVDPSPVDPGDNSDDSGGTDNTDLGDDGSLDGTVTDAAKRRAAIAARRKANARAHRGR